MDSCFPCLFKIVRTIVVFMIQLLLVDDHIIVRQGLKSLLESESNIKVVGEADNGKIAISKIKILHPDVVLMDIKMPVMNGLEATKIICQQYPDTKVLLLTTFGNTEYVSQGMKFGAKGYLLKNANLEDLILAIKSVSKDCTYFGSGIFEKTKKISNKIETKPLSSIIAQLTPREKEVLKLLATGARNKEIAKSLCLSESTVKNYVSRILSCLHLRDRTQAALFANSYEVSNTIF